MESSANQNPSLQDGVPLQGDAALTSDMSDAPTEEANHNSGAHFVQQQGTEPNASSETQVFWSIPCNIGNADDVRRCMDLMNCRIDGLVANFSELSTNMANILDSLAKITPKQNLAPKRPRLNEGDIPATTATNKRDSQPSWAQPDRKHTFRQRRASDTNTHAINAANSYELLSEDSNTMDCDADNFLSNKDDNAAGPSGLGQRTLTLDDDNNLLLKHVFDNNNNKDKATMGKKNILEAIRPVTVKKTKGGPKQPLSNATKVPNVPRVKFPPIIASIFNVKAFVNVLKEQNIVNFRYNVNNRSAKTTIYPGDRSAFDTILALLRTYAVKFYTQAPSDERRTNLIMKGVPVGFDLDDVKEEVKKLNLGDRIKVVPLKEGNKQALNYFILSLAPGVEHRGLIGDHRLFFTKIRIEKFNRNSAVQCYRCAGLGHVQKYCGASPRCHKCGQEHSDPALCPIKPDSPLEQRYCVLCDQHGHAASYKGCPTFKKEMLRKKELLAKKSKPIVREVSKLVQPNVSFASVARGSGGSGTGGRVPNENPITMSLNGAMTFLDEACLESFGCSYAIFQQKFSKFHADYKGTTSIEARRTLLMNFLTIP